MESNDAEISAEFINSEIRHDSDYVHSSLILRYLVRCDLGVVSKAVQKRNYLETCTKASFKEHLISRLVVHSAESRF